MKKQAQVVVIGGGIAGCSTLYHLVQEGIEDCVLVERDELTSGTTWHSAAQVTSFGTNQTMIALKKYSIGLYRKLAQDLDHPINYNYASGGMRLATTREHMDGYRHFAAVAKGMGVDFEVIDAQTCQNRHPLLNGEGLLGALWDPLDGDIDPTQLCHALARNARKGGAEIYRSTPVVDLTQKRDGSWIVHTINGDIECQVIVNAGGYRCNEIASMMGVELPVAAMEHQYIITTSMAKVKQCQDRLPLIRCPTDDFYCRQERDGLLVGFYEQDCKTWGMQGIDPNFTSALCPDDLERVSDVVERAYQRMPALTKAGVQSIINGPITYTPDGFPLVGPVPGKRNAFCCTGLRAGLGEGGGHGWLLAQMIAQGEAQLDVWCLDPRRFTRQANRDYAGIKAVEDYQNEFRFLMPHEERPAGRPLKVTPLYSEFKAQGAHFTCVNGWERVDYMKPSPDFVEVPTFRFSNAFDQIGREVQNVHENVGIAELGGFNCIEIMGRDLFSWLEHMSCSPIKRERGALSLAYFLNDQGCVKSEATIANLSASRVWYCSPAASQLHDLDWLNAHLPEDGAIRTRCVTERYTCLLIAGPNARALMANAAPQYDWSQASFPKMNVRGLRLGPVRVIYTSASYSGEEAFEIFVPMEQQIMAYEILMKAGHDLGIKPFGMRAIESMRIEKGYHSWKQDLLTEYDPFESGLGGFVAKGREFIGAQALKQRQANGARCKFVMVELDSKDAPAQMGTTIEKNGQIVGTVTSASWGYRFNKNLALGYLQPEFSSVGNVLEVNVLGELVNASVVSQKHLQINRL